MTVTSRDFHDDNAQHNRSIGRHSIAVEATGVIMTAHNLDKAIVTVAAHGDIDVRSAPGLADFACTHVVAGTTMIVDLTGVDFFGIAGLSVFEALDGKCAELNASWVLCSGRPVRRLLTASGLEHSVRGFSSLDDAMDAVL